jgi:hypothetical protein
MEKRYRKAKKRKKESVWQRLVEKDLELSLLELNMVKQAQLLERKRNPEDYIK